MNVQANLRERRKTKPPFIVNVLSNPNCLCNLEKYYVYIYYHCLYNDNIAETKFNRKI